ncbi:MAG: tetratricopeptide repeat protein [Bryobacteraceae bacterium]
MKRAKAGTALVVAAAFAGISLPAQASSKSSVAQAEDLYRRTEYRQSLGLLDLKSNDPAMNNLIGRDYFMMGDFKKAGDYFQQAVNAEPNSSDSAMWLGRAFGRRAETSNPFVAPGYASKARQWLEKAVQLDDKNSDAMSDLFDYYLDAPGFLGGGYDKAQAIARKIADVDPAEGYFARAKLAEKRNEYETAETQLRHAIEIAPHQVGHILELARFLANQGRQQESDAMFAKAETIAPEAPRVWYAKADTLIKQKRNLDEAKRLLQKYVQSSSITPDDPSKNDAQRLLKQVDGGA